VLKSPFEEEFRVRLTQVQLFIQSELDFFSLEIITDISRPLVIQGTRSIPEDRGFEKNSPGFQTSLSILMNRVHFPQQDTLKTKEV
jgi:hypothetical protein